MSSLRLWGAALVEAAGRFSEPSLSSSSGSLGAPDRLRSASERFADERRRVSEARWRDAERLGRGLRLTVEGFAQVDRSLCELLPAGSPRRAAVER